MVLYVVGLGLGNEKVRETLALKVKKVLDLRSVYLNHKLQIPLKYRISQFVV